MPLTPTPSSDVGEDASPVGMSRDRPAQTAGLRTPETPIVNKQREGEPAQTDSGSRRVSALRVYCVD